MLKVCKAGVSTQSKTSSSSTTSLPKSRSRIVVVLVPNGSGKSTLIKLVVGYMETSKDGEV